MVKVIGFVSSAIAWFLKNVNMIVGIIGSISKLVCGLINVFQPSKDDLVDKITEITEKIQKALHKASETLKKFGG
jgi:ElaB/YqjD/DUF883 family membrane-anchored ribosome-binding protein|tara:strand:- start:143 stop:367 length:225 start_codon:yes stop_codon:yes gene_type:complete